MHDLSEVFFFGWTLDTTGCGRVMSLSFNVAPSGKGHTNKGDREIKVTELRT